MKFNLVISLVILIATNSCNESQKESQSTNSTKTDWAEIEKKINANDKNKLFLSYWIGMDSTEFIDISHYLANKKSIYIDTMAFSTKTIKLTYIYSKFNNTLNQADTVSFTLSPFWTKDKKLARISLRLNNNPIDSEGKPTDILWVSLKEVMLDLQEEYGYPTEEEINIEPSAFEYLSLNDDSTVPSDKLKIPSISKDLILLQNNKIRLFGFKKNDLRVVINQEKYKSLMSCRDMVWDCIDLMNDTISFDYTNIQQIKKEIQAISPH